MKENFIIRALLLNMLTFWLVLHGNEKDSPAIKVQLTQVFENIQTPSTHSGITDTWSCKGATYSSSGRQGT